jgi:alkanesulfonate monooxygenase SsuD/methylene tetrahydromethanopterin reductase-like flavin-dependent oxidoreductase (luciferase family)
MRVGLIQEGDFTGTTMQARYREMIVEVTLADKLGFSAWGTSEQHFSPPSFSVSAPEVLYAAVAENTSRITLRNMAAVLVQYNHPVMVAERVATLDIISGGRAELCTARSNNIKTLTAFGVPIATTQEQWAEGLEIVKRAFGDEELEYDGEFWKIGKCDVTPKPLQKPYPPLSVTATSAKTHGLAGSKGIGVISFDNYLGYDYVDESVAIYAKGLASRPQDDLGNNYFGYYVPSAFCAETREEAMEVAQHQTLKYFRAILELYKGMASKPSYEYMKNIEVLTEHQDDMEFLMRHTPAVMVGTPDDFIAEFRDLDARGVDEVLLRIDGFGHENHMRTLQLIGEHVIPHVGGDAGKKVRDGVLAEQRRLLTA